LYQIICHCFTFMLKLSNSSLQVLLVTRMWVDIEKSSFWKSCHEELQWQDFQYIRMYFASVYGDACTCRSRRFGHLIERWIYRLLWSGAKMFLSAKPLKTVNINPSKTLLDLKCFVSAAINKNLQLFWHVTLVDWLLCKVVTYQPNCTASHSGIPNIKNSVCWIKNIKMLLYCYSFSGLAVQHCDSGRCNPAWCSPLETFVCRLTLNTVSNVTNWFVGVVTEKP
jgi:hypothetical protein